MAWYTQNSMGSSLEHYQPSASTFNHAPASFNHALNPPWQRNNTSYLTKSHYGAVETSVVQAFWPDLIAGPISEAAHCEPAISPAKTQAVMQALGTHAITRSGIWGAPEQSDAKKGELLITALTKAMHEQTSRILELVNEQQNSGYLWEEQT